MIVYCIFDEKNKLIAIYNDIRYAKISIENLRDLGFVCEMEPNDISDAMKMLANRS